MSENLESKRVCSLPVSRERSKVTERILTELITAIRDQLDDLTIYDGVLPVPDSLLSYVGSWQCRPAKTGFEFFAWGNSGEDIASCSLTAGEAFDLCTALQQLGIFGDFEDE